MLERLRYSSSDEAVGQPADDDRLRPLQDDVPTDAATANVMLAGLRERGGLETAASKGDQRVMRLKCGGNGVVPLCAAVAFVVLARRAGLFI